jgi:hypothetical protein
MTVQEFLDLFKDVPKTANIDFEDESEEGYWDECDGIWYDRGQAHVRIRTIPREKVKK